MGTLPFRWVAPPLSRFVRQGGVLDPPYKTLVIPSGTRHCRSSPTVEERAVEERPFRAALSLEMDPGFSPGVPDLGKLLSSRAKQNDERSESLCAVEGPCVSRTVLPDP